MVGSAAEPGHCRSCSSNNRRTSRSVRTSSRNHRPPRKHGNHRTDPSEWRRTPPPSRRQGAPTCPNRPPTLVARPLLSLTAPPCCGDLVDAAVCVLGCVAIRVCGALHSSNKRSKKRRHFQRAAQYLSDHRGRKVARDSGGLPIAVARMGCVCAVPAGGMSGGGPLLTKKFRPDFKKGEPQQYAD